MAQTNLQGEIGKYCGEVKMKTKKLTGCNEGIVQWKTYINIVMIVLKIGTALKETSFSVLVSRKERKA